MGIVSYLNICIQIEGESILFILAYGCSLGDGIFGVEMGGHDDGHGNECMALARH